MKKRFKIEKETLVWIIVFIAIGAFILLIPTIDNFLTGRHHESVGGTGTKEEENVYNKIVCNIPEVTKDNYTTVGNFTVNFDSNGKIKSSVVSIVKTFNDKETYTELEKPTTLETTGTGYSQKLTYDDENMIYTVHVNFDNTKFSTSSNETALTIPSNSPTNKTTMDNFLKNKNYICSKQK